MSDHKQDIDFSTFLLGAAASLVLLAVVIFLLVQLVSFIAPDREVAEQDRERMMQLAEERIESPARVQAGEAEEAAEEAADARPSDQVYSDTCAACHDTGTAEAPIMGERGDWDERIEQDFDTLVQHVIDGLGAMPPRGGDDSLTDDEIRWTVAYMMRETEIDMDGVEAALEEEEQALAGNGEPAADEVAEDEPAEEDVPEDEAAEDEAAADDEEVVEDVDAEEVREEMAENDEVSLEDLNISAGRSVYDSACAACHAAGVAGAPRAGEVQAWEDRLDKGLATLIEHSINGFRGDDGFMPPRGGRSGLSDEEVANAVGYMVDQVQ